MSDPIDEYYEDQIIEEPTRSFQAPHSVDAERLFLSALLADSGAWDLAVGKVSADDFHVRSHQLVYKALEDLANKGEPLEPVTLAERLDSLGELEAAGGAVGLAEIVEGAASSSGLLHYAQIVRENSVRRQLISTAEKIRHRALRPEGLSAEEVLDRSERDIYEIADQSSGRDDPQVLSDVLADLVEKLEKNIGNTSGVSGLATGFHDLDELTTGFQPADLVVVAGRPGMGKTSFALNIAEQAVMDDPEGAVLFFSLEQPSSQLGLRVLSSLSGIDMQKLRRLQLGAAEWPSLTAVFGQVERKALYLYDMTPLTTTQIRSQARRIHREKKPLRLIIVDYMQLMTPTKGRDNWTLELGDISKDLKSIAKEFDVPVVVLSQLNRALETRPNKRPMMADLRDSGAIEQDADLIIFIYRDEVYNPNDDNEGLAEIIVGKQRNGPTDTIKLTYFAHNFRFVNYSPRESVSS